MQEYSDIELVEEYLNGNQKSFEILIKRYLKSLYNFIYGYVNNSEVADDITQNVFLKIWKNIDKFQKDKSFKTWIFCIAKNTVFDFFKKKKDVSFSQIENSDEFNGNESLNFEESIIDNENLPNEILEKKETKEFIGRILLDIPIKYREILKLYYYGEFNFREISEILDEPMDTIKSRHRRGVIMLRKMLIENNKKM
jgi:RNA polymerase sigma factor (sigma-70 family)